MDEHVRAPDLNPSAPFQPPPSFPSPKPLPSAQLQQISSPPPTQPNSAIPALPEMTPGKQKDPKESSKEASKKRSPEPIDNPPAKRPREPMKQKVRLTWYDTIRDVWSILETQNSGRHQFRAREIVKIVDSHWTQLRGEEKKQKGWRNQLSRSIRKEAMLTRVQADGQSDLYAMKDPNFQPPPPRPSKKSPVPENETTPEESVYHVSIPAEWTNEAFKPVRLSTFDKSAALQFVNDDPNTIKGHKGYRMARATSGVIEGDWYFEATVNQLRDQHDTADGAVRLGWSQRRSDVETPVGFDAYGFGLRDRTGEFINAARLKPYGKKFGVGDVIGCRISLPQLSDEQKASIHEADRAWLTYRFINMLQGQAPKDSGIDIIKEARVQFYLNGTAMGNPSFFEEASAIADKGSSVPKREMKAGNYYPSVALYGSAIVQANFGPDFRFPLPEGSRPMCEAARERPPVEEKEIVDVEDVPTNPAQTTPGPADSVPTDPTLQFANAPNGVTPEPKPQNQPVIVQEPNVAAKEQSDENGMESRPDPSQDTSCEGTEQPRPEPMAIEA